MRSARRTQKSRTWQSKFIKASCTLRWPIYRSFGHWNRRFGSRTPICGKSLRASMPRQARSSFLRQYRSRRDRPDSSRNRAKASTTLALVISKSGGTPETRNGMLEAEKAFSANGLDFAKQAIAITGEGSRFTNTPLGNGWLDFFPMWDWVGGRTSETAAVGLLPAALQGIDADQLLEGRGKWTK